MGLVPGRVNTQIVTGEVDVADQITSVPGLQFGNRGVGEAYLLHGGLR